MSKTINIILLLGILLLSTEAIAQKMAHINSAELLSAMPEAKTAEAKLDAYTKELDKQYKNKVKAAETEFQQFLKKVEGGGVSDNQKAERRKYFQDKQREIYEFEVSAQQKIARKRDELLAPILKKAQTAIQSVAKEKNYVYIFDIALGHALYFDTSKDVTSLVKVKLGI